MNQSERRPDRMIATEHETTAGPPKDRLHATPVSIDTRRAPVVKVSAVNRAPEVRVEFEVRATPLAVHRAKELFEMLLHLRVRAVQHVPWTTTPAAERYAI